MCDNIFRCVNLNHYSCIKSHKHNLQDNGILVYAIRTESYKIAKYLLKCGYTINSFVLYAIQNFKFLKYVIKNYKVNLNWLFIYISNNNNKQSLWFMKQNVNTKNKHIINNNTLFSSIINDYYKLIKYHRKYKHEFDYKNLKCYTRSLGFYYFIITYYEFDMFYFEI
jgi:hypothetical protein